MMDVVAISDRLDVLEARITDDNIPEHIQIAQTRALLEIAILLIDIRNKLASINQSMPEREI
jgi:hypothetical protein